MPSARGVSRRGSRCGGCFGHRGNPCLVVEAAAGDVAEDVLQRRQPVRRRGGPRRSAPPEFVGGAEGADAAAVHQGDPVAVLVGLVHVVGGHQDGHAGGRAYGVDVLPHAGAGDRVEADGRLVEDQQAGRADQRLGEFEPADHAAGVGAGQPVGGVGEVHRVQRLGDAVGAFAAGDVEDAGEQCDVLPAGQARVGGQLLRHVAEQAAYRHPVPGRVVAEDPDHAGRDRQQRGDAADRGRLAGAVGAEQSEDLALAHGQVEAVDGVGLTEGVGESGAGDGLGPTGVSVRASCSSASSCRVSASSRRRRKRPRQRLPVRRRRAGPPAAYELGAPLRQSPRRASAAGVGISRAARRSAGSVPRTR